MRLNDQSVAVEYSKAVNDMRAKLWVDVFRDELADSLTIPSPIGEVANNLEVLSVIRSNFIVFVFVIFLIDITTNVAIDINSVVYWFVRLNFLRIW
jgi:hypothetical protein